MTIDVTRMSDEEKELVEKAQWQQQYDAIYRAKAEQEEAELLARLDQQLAPRAPAPAQKSDEELSREREERDARLARWARENTERSAYEREYLKRCWHRMHEEITSMMTAGR